MTVRQLESMIRLSEALAKLHCDTEVSPRYVLRAKKLLEDSIVGVESDSIDLDEEEEELARSATSRPVDEENSMDVDEEVPNVRASGVAATSTTQIAAAEKSKLAIDYEKYRKISNAIVTRLRQNEEQGEDEGMRMSKVIDWYLETIEDELDSEEELLQEQRIVTLVIKRLYTKVGITEQSTGGLYVGTEADRLLLLPQDHVLIRLRHTESLSADAAEEDPQDEQDPILFVHPNYVVDE